MTELKGVRTLEAGDVWVMRGKANVQGRRSQRDIEVRGEVLPESAPARVVLAKLPLDSVRPHISRIIVYFDTFDSEWRGYHGVGPNVQYFFVDEVEVLRANMEERI